MAKIEFSNFEQYFKDFPLHSLYYSFNGVGKTTFAGRTGLKTVLLDCGDSGVVTLKGVKHLRIVKIRGTSHYLDVMDEINRRSDEFDLLVPDSLTGLTSMAIKEVKGRRGDMNRRKWGLVGSKVIECISETNSFPKDVIYLAQERRRTNDEGEGDVTFYSPSLNPGVREFLSGSIDWVGRMYLEGEKRKLSFILSSTQEAKDRADPPVFPKVLSLPELNGEVYPAYSAIRKRIMTAVQK
jgi:phage nucleotide-binding protein